MLNFKTKSLVVLLTATGAVGTTFADRLILKDDSRLTGTVRSIDGQGAVELVSALAADPLFLRASAVEKVEFSVPEEAAGTTTALIELTNGDTLPATIESLDDRQLKVITDDLGRLSIPRAALKSMQVGLHPEKAIYTGPSSLEEWTKGELGAKNWRFNKQGLVASGNDARALKSFNLPPRFVVKFTLKWRANPNFQIFFADPLTAGVERVDRYYLQFNSGGVEVKREAAKGKRFQSVILLPRTPDQFPDNELAVEIRVDRKESRLQLLLNGEPETAGVDPIPDKPTGGGIVIVSNSAPGSNQEIRAIEVREYDNSQTRHLAEDRGDGKSDSLISREDDRLGGRLASIRNGEGGNVFMMESDFQDAPLEIPETDVSTVFFAKKPAEAAAPAALPLVLRLRGQGTLHVSSCVFAETTVTARHPLLGDLTVARAGISSLERLNPEPEGKSK